MSKEDIKLWAMPAPRTQNNHIQENQKDICGILECGLCISMCMNREYSLQHAVYVSCQAWVRSRVWWMAQGGSVCPGLQWLQAPSERSSSAQALCTRGIGLPFLLALTSFLPCAQVILVFLMQSLGLSPWESSLPKATPWLSVQTCKTHTPQCS